MQVSVVCSRAAFILAGAVAPFVVTQSVSAQPRYAYVLTTTAEIVTVDVNDPNTIVTSMPVTGVAAGETLVGIDIRADNGTIYTVGVNHAANTLSVYALSARTGVAGRIGAGGITGVGDLPDPAVARYGVDVNPMTDRLRVTTSQSGAGPATPGLNLRLDVTTGALVQADADINPAPISIDEVAHTDNNRRLETTTLYTISSAQDALYIQNLPNSGTQTAAVALSQDLAAVHGFDLDTGAIGQFMNGPVTANSTQGFAVVTIAAGGTGLVRINLTTGAVGTLAPIAGNAANIRGFAVRYVAAAYDLPITILRTFEFPQHQAILVRRPVIYESGTPAEMASPMTGLVAGDKMFDIDLRPQTGQLYGLAHNPANNTLRLYLIDPYATFISSTATPLGVPIALNTPGPTQFGFDFNPTVDRIRVVTNVGDNLRINPDTGALVQFDAPISPGTSSIGAAAYTNSFGQTLGANPTTLYVLDATTNSLAIQNPPNNGTLTSSLLLNEAGQPYDFHNVTSLDIPADVQVATANAPASGKALALLTEFNTSSTTLFTIDLATGVIFRIGSGINANGIAVGDGPTTLAPTTTTLFLKQQHVGLGDRVRLEATASVSTLAGGGYVTFFVDGVAVGAAAIGGNGLAVLTTTSVGGVGTHQVTAMFSGSISLDSSTSAPVELQVGQFKQHFAEGATGFFQTDIGVFNASNDHTANVTLTLFPEGAAPITVNATLERRRRHSFDVNAILLANGLSASVSSLIESDQPMAATRQMTWGSPVYGSTLESGVANTSTSWYFAEGATSTFSLYFLVQNPNVTPTDVTFTHLLEGGAAPVVRTVTVAANSRQTFDINAVPGLAQAALSTVITSTLPIVAERAMYITGTATRFFEAGAASAGAPALSTNWSLAEGATGFFYTYLLIGNPGTTAATVTVRYQLPNSTEVVRTYTVAPESRRTVDVAFEDALLASTSFSMEVTSTEPIVAERAMWWGLPFREGSVVTGTTTTAPHWGIGEAAEGGANDESTFVLLSNSAGTIGGATVILIFDDGFTNQSSYQLPPTSRLTLRMATEFPQSIGKKFSVLVHTTNLTVEYARYQSAAGFLESGGAALATPVYQQP